MTQIHHPMLFRRENHDGSQTSKEETQSGINIKSFFINQVNSDMWRLDTYTGNKP